MFHGRRRWMVGVGSAVSVVGVVALALALILGRGAIGAHADTTGDGIGTPQFTTDLSAPPGLKTADTIPYWSASFTDPTNGVTYPYTMVGTNPFTGSASTKVPTVIIPLSFTFDNHPSGVNPTLDGSTKTALTEQSPIFQSADIGTAADATASAPPAGVSPSPRVENEPSDTTQFADAYFRSEFGKSGSSYHLLLGQPTVLATQSFDVAADKGVLVVGSVSHARIGLINITWFSDRLHSLLGSLHLDPHTLPIFLTYNTFLYIKTTANCCVLGFHGAASPSGLGSGNVNGNGNQAIETWIYTAYNDPGIFGPNPGDNNVSYIQDIHALSHEVSEWSNDPFVHNFVNPWAVASAPQYGCTTVLEVGDPVVGFGFSVVMPNGVTYHPEDEVFFSWFARQHPSISSSASATTPAYTYLNNFAKVAQPCA